ncbi:hypothetical protein [Lactiplantibacillus pingfangensis]|nr:hypothetical protein [Lactiplantibacillus pingfangensis]
MKVILAQSTRKAIALSLLYGTRVWYNRFNKTKEGRRQYAGRAFTGH